MQLKPHSARTIPMATSMISAGLATEIVEDFQMLDINELVTKGRDGFVSFEVTGDSMVDNIHPGYLVFVDSWAEPKNGDIIASSVNGLTCIKIFQHSPHGLFLVSTNKNYLPRQVTAGDSFRVLGVVRGHLALYR